MMRIFFALCLLAVASGPCHARVFTGKGSAVIIDGDAAKAKNLAEQSALRKAAAEAMMSLIPEDSDGMRKFNAQKGRLLGEKHPFITANKTIGESTSDGLLMVEVQIDVDQAQLESFLRQAGIFAAETLQLRKGDFPAVAVIVSEEVGGGINSAPYSAGIIRQALLDAGFEVVDDHLIQKSIKHDQAVQALLNNDLKAAQAVTLQYGAGVLVTGKATAQKSAVQSGGMQVHGANVVLEAVKADSGRVLATAAAESNYPHINALTGSRKALEEAAEKAAKELVKKISGALETSIESVLVSISGLNYKQLAIIKQIFERDFPQITGIKQQSFNGGVAKLDLTLQVSVTEFMDKIALHDFGTFKLDVINFSPGKADLALKMKPPKTP